MFRIFQVLWFVDAMYVTKLVREFVHDAKNQKLLCDAASIKQMCF